MNVARWLTRVQTIRTREEELMKHWNTAPGLLVVATLLLEASARASAWANERISSWLLPEDASPAVVHARLQLGGSLERSWS